MKKCYGYVRVSTTRQGDGVSLEAQRAAIEAFADRNGLVITKWFEELETAAKRGRPVFTAMLQELRQRHADGVIMHKIDRSARNFADWAKIGDLSDAGIDVHFASESLDFRSRGGRLSADIQAVIAADYVRNLREEIKKGIYGRLTQGLYPFAAPIGYLDNGGGEPKTIDPTRGPLVRRAFELYGSGQFSLRSLLTELRRLGLRNKNRHLVSKCGLETILANPFYCGLIRIRKSGQVYQGAHEPLISPRLYQRVQDIKAGRAGKKVTHHNHTYRGLFSCAYCHNSMIAERQKGRVYYRCQLRECPTKCVREEVIEAAVYSVFVRVRFSNEDARIVLSRMETWLKSRHKTKPANSAKLQLGRIDARLDALTEALMDRLVDQDTYSKHKEKLLLEKLQLEETNRADVDEQVILWRAERFLELTKSLANNYISADPAEKRELVELATSNRTVALKNVTIEPANWLLMGENAIAGLIGGPERTTSRTPTEQPDEQITQLVSLMQSGECVAAVNKLNQKLT